MTATTLTATLPNGETVKRTTKRTYTHIVTAEITYTDGTTTYINPEWTGRPALAQKALAKRQAWAARETGTEVIRHTRANGIENTGIYRKNVTPLLIPVNA